MAAASPKKSVLRHSWIIPVAIAAIAPWAISSYELNILGRFLSMSILSVGLVLVWGEAGILSLGQGVFFGLGGYALAMNLKLATLTSGGLPDFMEWSGRESLPWWWEPFHNPFFAVAAVILVPGLVAALFSWLVVRRRIFGVYFALITQALALAFATLLISQQGMTGGFNGLTDFQTLFGINLGGKAEAWGLYWITLGLLTCAFLGVRWLMESRFGTLLRATRDGENRVRFLGYDPTPYKVVAFTVGAMLAGLAGALFTLHAGVISPAAVGVVPSIEMVVFVAVGGRNSLWGAIAGTLLVNFAKDDISSALPDVWLYVLGAIFILVVTLMPRGIAGVVDGLLRKLRPRNGAASAAVGKLGAKLESAP